MATAAVLVPTTVGDAINPLELWTGVTPTTLRYQQTIQRRAGVPTQVGDDINPLELWTGVTPTTLRYVWFEHHHLYGVFWDTSQWRRWTMLVDGNTVQPVIGGKTQFPRAQ